jgi:hypothetical protein
LLPSNPFVISTQRLRVTFRDRSKRTLFPKEFRVGEVSL